MIGFLRGTLLAKLPPKVLIETSGVGYEVRMPMSCFYELPAIKSEVSVYTHFIVREGEQMLYGFNSEQERTLFKEIIKVSGVGPQLGLAIMSGMTADQFSSCVKHGDIATLVKLPGIGKKTAERLFIEMRDRLNPQKRCLTGPIQPNVEEDIAATERDAVSALVALGYKPLAATSAVKKAKAIEPGMTAEDIIRKALRMIL